MTAEVELPAIDAEELVGETVTSKITDDRYKVFSVYALVSYPKEDD